MKTHVILILNFTRPHAITHTNRLEVPGELGDVQLVLLWPLQRAQKNEKNCQQFWKINSVSVCVNPTNPKYAITLTNIYVLRTGALCCNWRWLSVSKVTGWGSPLSSEVLWDTDSAHTASRTLLSRPLTEVTCGSSLCFSWFDCSSSALCGSNSEYSWAT